MKRRKGVRATIVVEYRKLWDGGRGLAVSWWCQCHMVTKGMDLGVTLLHGLESRPGPILACGTLGESLLESHLKQLV